MKIEKIPLSKLVTDKANPRVDMEELDELADSLQKNGQQVPLNVEDLKDSRYLINNGHRRFMAFAIVKKRTKQEPMVDCIVENKLSPEERLIKQALIDIQTKNWTTAERDSAWIKIWNTKKQDIGTFSKMLGTNRLQVELFLDRMNLDKEIKKLDLGVNMIGETRGMDNKIRTPLLQKVAREGMGRQQLREVIKVIKNTKSETIQKALLNGEINVEQAGQIKNLKDEKQEIAIESIKHMNKQIKTIPKLVERDKITSKKMDEKTRKLLQLQEFIERLQTEIGNASSQMITIEGVLKQIVEENLDDVFNPKLRNTLATVLEELQETISPTVDRIEKTIKKWRN